MDDIDRATLLADADPAHLPPRVAYADGMLLGLEATRAEQAHHRRRLAIHQHWLHGAGTVAGMAVEVRAMGADPGPDRTRATALVVHPGVAIDGLGREILLVERHCLRLDQWLVAQTREDLDAGYDPLTRRLHLRITARYRDCPQGAQPVLANLVNQGTDAVDVARIGAAVELELSADTAKGVHDPFVANSWRARLQAVPPERLSAAEEARIGAAGANAEALRRRLERAHAFTTGELAAEAARPEAVAERARILLATVVLDPAPEPLDPATLVVRPERVAIDNLVRPFVPLTAEDG